MENISDITFLGNTFKKAFEPFLDTYTLNGRYGFICEDNASISLKWLDIVFSVDVTLNLETLGCKPLKLLIRDNNSDHYYKIFQKHNGDLYVLVMAAYNEEKTMYEAKSITLHKKHFYTFMKALYIFSKGLDRV